MAPEGSRSDHSFYRVLYVLLGVQGSEKDSKPKHIVLTADLAECTIFDEVSFTV